MRWAPRARRVRVHVRTPLKPTEDAERVKAAITNIFPDAVVDVVEDEVRGTTDSLDRLRELIRNEQIPDSARGAMLSRLTDDGMKTTFLLGKQAAAVRKAHFGTVHGPLGDLEVLLLGDEPGEVERAVYRAAPDTTVDKELSQVPLSERPAQEE